MSEAMNDRPNDRQDPEVLISRIVDGEATQEDWNAFHLQANREPSLWRELAEAQQMHAELGEEVGVALAVSSLVDAPTHVEIERRFNNRIRMVGVWGGWLAAACLGLMWANNARPAPSSLGGAGSQANLGDTLASYLNRGKEEGRVLGELPEKVLVSATPVTGSDGNDIGNGYVVVYLRQILERVEVKDLYQLGEDDAGRQQPVPYDVPPARHGKPM